MPLQTQHLFEFGEFRLDLAEKRLERDGTVIPITPKVFETLRILVENAGHLVEKNELMERIWHDRFVEESNLAFNIKMLRKALGDDAAKPRFIETVPRRGYRFIADVRSRNTPSTKDSQTTRPEQAEPAGKRYILISVAVVLLVSVFGIAFVWFSGNSFSKGKQPKLARLTSVGKVTNVALLPDGKSFVFSQKDGSGESLWLRRIDSGTQTQVRPPEDVEYVGLAVSPDSNFAYYSTFSKNAAVATLSRVSLEGGTPPEQVPNVDTDVSISFSPDGAKFAFTDSRSSTKETSLMIADADGTNQRTLVKTVGEERSLPFFRASPVAWSPDGTTIACVVRETGESGSFSRILLVDPETGTEQYLSDRSWSGVENIAWKDSDHLALAESELSSPVKRIWQVSRSTGEARQLTNDLNGYKWLSASAGRLVALQQDTFSSLHVAEVPEDANNILPKQILGESGTIESVSWSRDEKIFYNSASSGKNEVWQINPDGTSPLQVTSDSGLIYTFAVSPADDSLVFSSLRNGNISLATTGRDGRNFRPLTDGALDMLPAFLPTGEKIIFQRGNSRPTLWSVELGDGRLPDQITGYQSTHPAVSPDGKQIAFHYMDYGGKDPHWKLGVIDSETHQFLDKREFPLPITERQTVWGPNADLLTMTFSNGEKSGIILWSVPNGTTRILSDIDAGRIGAFAWSPDGNRLAFSLIFEKADVVSLDSF